MISTPADLPVVRTGPETGAAGPLGTGQAGIPRGDRGDHESSHNRKYWDHTPYLGLGPSAHSLATADAGGPPLASPDPGSRTKLESFCPAAEVERVSLLAGAEPLEGARSEEGLMVAAPGSKLDSAAVVNKIQLK